METQMETPRVKKPWESKVLWINLVLALAALIGPGTHQYLEANPEVLTLLFSGINIILRFTTKDKLSVN